MDKKRKKYFIIVNAITLSRILGSALLFPIFFYYGQNVIGIILSVLFATDWIDGYLARKHNVCTFFGSIMDGVCDKVMAIISCLILCYLNPFMIVSIALELLIFIVNTFALMKNGNVKSSQIGKTKMWFLSLSVILGFFLSKPHRSLINFLIAVPAIIAELITLIDYTFKTLKLKFKITKTKPKYKKFKDIKKMLFDPEFYEQYKDQKGLISHIYKDGNN
ncbi:MAG: CDP-alcohol phosphatidyltransferase family protein [Bacilli bacterium]|nr:CDP-alcohol phosphatidyltransferase family protein [Bacilli bacterium]